MPRSCRAGTYFLYEQKVGKDSLGAISLAPRPPFDQVTDRLPLEFPHSGNSPAKCTTFGRLPLDPVLPAGKRIK